LRERYDEITSLGAGIVAIGTGDRRYAEAFVRDERIPFLVLVDDGARNGFSSTR
jgi:peroxiredoxin